MRPLDGIRVLDLTRLAPGPYCTMVLADLGADVLRIEEPGPPTGRRSEQGAGRTIDFDALGFLPPESPYNPLHRGKRSIGLNLKSSEGRRVFLRLVQSADVLVEEFRPGVADRLGIGFASLRELNERLIYCAITGYGQDGPYAQRPGHDINYLATAGLLAAMGPADGPPAIPLNLVADYAGGALHAVIGILAALMARQRTGRGQLIDISMTEAVMSLLGPALGYHLATGHVPHRGAEALDGGAPFYGVYQTRDGGWLSVGAVEPWFFANLCRALGRDELIEHQFDRSRWPEMRRQLADTFASRSRDEWLAVLDGCEACVAPVLGYGELRTHPQHRARGVFQEMPGDHAPSATQVAPAIRLSDTPARLDRAAGKPFEQTDEVLAALGYDAAAIESLRAQGAVR